MLTRRLFEIRNQYDESAAAEKLAIMRQLAGTKFTSAAELKLFHNSMCFIRAFPDTAKHHSLASAELANTDRRVAKLARAERARLDDSGLSGTAVHYAYSYEVATWLARRTHGTVSIDREEDHDPPGLDELLRQLIQPAEDEYFDGGNISAMAWLALAAQRSKGTDFDWLLEQLKQPQFTSIWAQLYNAMDLWLAWDLTGARFSKSTNTFPLKEIGTRQRGMRKPPASVKAEIQRPIDSVARLDRNAGTKLIDVAMASLAVRHRETYHFNHANPREVYLTDAGDGVSIAIFGLQNSYRFPLECTMGYLILANGVPIGYGGASVMFRQVNTGANIFSEYRGSEAAFLWVQVMRAYHHVTGCTRFIANPYQFGSENDEALKSGAFWFYYRLGYRPVMQDVRTLARREFAKIRRNRKHRSDLKTLRRLASCDMHLTLPGARQSDLFDEQWIETSSMLATRALSAAGGRTWKTAANRVTGTLARDLGLHNLDKWSAPERMGLKRIAPIAVAAHPGDWTVEERRDMRKLLRAKGGEFEARYARMMSRHERFLAALRKACRRADSIT